MKQQLFFLLPLLSTIAFSCNQQKKTIPAVSTSQSVTVGGGCDGCEMMYINMPENMLAVDTSAGWHEEGEKLLIKGTVFKKDGKTAAENIIIYYWQTNNNGLYSPVAGMDEKAKRHGHIRGWMKTGKDGKYALYTVRPAPYPGTDNPAHIHLSIKEPGFINEYYTDELVFDDDTLLTTEKKQNLENRGGSGILHILTSGNLQVADHNIILGLNIPGYPGE